MNTTLIYPVETVATFRCRLESGAEVDWLINGSETIKFAADLNPSLRFLLENGTIVNTLSITVTPEHNNTKVSCVGTVDGAPVVSPNVTITITITGLLHPVLNHLIRISWCYSYWPSNYYHGTTGPNTNNHE